ncbi:trypsin-like peptidase domain-containing protein [Jejuia spongiicola]|uniref:Trypsin-like peptidase domain-containing protein n=1 Tax=Jejuia spongiicola TaxID=2942207 RepID=A0ABT0QG67_9FLAO|nr:trypsin-like peptidase domain-containing protein [Jejuia spongiicola]MCL6295991.1 trypsin-like peptidase domain-containing protein [Jejuia spongiicola]
MKKILTLVLVSALGGILTLSAYKLFLEPEQKLVVTSNNTTPTFLPTNNIGAPLKAYENSDFTTAAENTVNAVVHVKNVSLSGGQMTMQDLFFGRNPQQKQLGTGSGVIVDPSGYIITNNHVIKNSQELSVTLNNNKTYKAEIIGTDSETDIAVLKINADEDLPVVNFGDSDQAKIGEWVLAVGNPFNLTSTVTAGIISAKSRSLDPTGRNAHSFIQTDAAVNPGNSGGALVNTNGELIGINTAITSQTGSYVGYSFAVPSNIARKIYMDILEYGNTQNGVLGITAGVLNSASAEEFGVDDTEGVFVNDVTKKSGAEKAGIKKGDIIKQLDHIEISKFEDLKGYLKTKRPNDVVNVKLLRNDELLTIPVTISKTDIFSVKFMNMEFRDLSTSIKEKYEIPNGVQVSKTNNKYLYSNLGITEGYIITEINNKKIESIQDISKLKEKYGDDFVENLEQLAYINTRLEKKEVIFK